MTLICFIVGVVVLQISNFDRLGSQFEICLINIVINEYYLEITTELSFRTMVYLDVLLLAPQDQSYFITGLMAKIKVNSFDLTERELKLVYNFSVLQRTKFMVIDSLRIVKGVCRSERLEAVYVD